jgi:hypothetical protein
LGDHHRAVTPKSPNGQSFLKCAWLIGKESLFSQEEKRMTNKAMLVWGLFVGTLAFGIHCVAEETTTSGWSGKVVAAAQKFLDSLDESQRGKVEFAFNDEAQRKRWSNLPIGVFKRGGLRMGDLSASQQAAAHELLKVALSPHGYEKTMQIVEADEVLKTTDRRPPPRRPPGPLGPPGGGPGFGRDNYYIALLGKPSAQEPWMIQFGGHHLGLNITLAGEHTTLAPSHTGAQPAIYELEGKTIRPLGSEVEKAFALLSSLDDAQRKKAILGFEIRDLVLGPGRDGQTIEPEGIKGSDLTEKQRGMLLDLASEWTGITNETVATPKMEEMKKNVDATWFAWSGPTEKDAAAYFRIQGPTVVIEFAPQRLGGDLKKHIHTIYRDPTNDYGRAPVTK